MKCSIAAFFAGLIAWVLVISLLDRVLRLTIEGYVAAEPHMTFTLGMLLARLGISAATSVIAGAVTGWITRSSARVSLVLGSVVLAVFIPIHVMLWHSFPAWYHLTFLVSLVPLMVIGSRLAQAGGRRVLANQAV